MKRFHSLIFLSSLLITSFQEALYFSDYKSRNYQVTIKEQPKHNTPSFGILLGIGAAVLAIKGLYTWSEHTTIDETPYETYLNKKSYILNDYRWLFDDVEYYSRGARIAILVNERITHAQFPTLEYYATIEKVIKQLEDILYALKRKLKKEHRVTTRLHLQDHIHHTHTLINGLEMYRKEVKGSNSYTLECNAKHPQIEHHYVNVKVNEPVYVYR